MLPELLSDEVLSVETDDRDDVSIVEIVDDVDVLIVETGEYVDEKEVLFETSDEKEVLNVETVDGFKVSLLGDPTSAE